MSRTQTFFFPTLIFLFKIPPLPVQIYFSLCSPNLFFFQNPFFPYISKVFLYFPAFDTMADVYDVVLMLKTFGGPCLSSKRTSLLETYSPLPRQDASPLVPGELHKIGQSDKYFQSPTVCTAFVCLLATSPSIRILATPGPRGRGLTPLTFNKHLIHHSSLKGH